MQLAAIINGKKVSYPSSATFIIERARNNQSYGLLAHRDTIDRALGKFHSSRLPGHRVRLSAVDKGRAIPLARI